MVVEKLSYKQDKYRMHTYYQSTGKTEEKGRREGEREKRDTTKKELQEKTGDLFFQYHFSKPINIQWIRTGSQP